MRTKSLTGLAAASLLVILSAGTACPSEGSHPLLQNPAGVDRRPLVSSEQRGDIFMARKEYADAVDFYLRAVREVGEKNPAAAMLWNKMGIAFQQEEHYRDARKAYNRALKCNQGFSEAWNNLGTTYFLADKFGKSVKYYKRALTLDPSSASYHLNLGTSYSRMKKYPLAIDEYRTALTLDPHVLHGDYASTAPVVEARSVSAEYFFCVAKVLASLGRTNEAVRYLRRAFEDGFRDDKKLDADPDFLKISKDPSYIALRTNPPIAIKD